MCRERRETPSIDALREPRLKANRYPRRAEQNRKSPHPYEERVLHCCFCGTSLFENARGENWLLESFEVVS
jgi:hypothetical protein